MGIAVNGRDIADCAVEAELAFHQLAGNPLKEAVNELVLRRVLLDEAARLGIKGDDEDSTIAALFEHEVKVPEVDTPAAERFFAANKARFMLGELAEVRHILFQVTPTVPLDLLRSTGEAVLAELRQRPERFEELARQYSNCPSGAIGGSLGQVTRGQTAPEFEALVFRLAPGELSGRLLQTRFGLHIVQVLRKVEGICPPFETLRPGIAAELADAAWRRAIHQYLHVLAGRANIEGVSLEGTDTPLVQ